MNRRAVLRACSAAFAAVIVTAAPAPGSAQGKKIVVGLPGIPPVFSTLIGYVAEKEGLFKQYGADVELRPFDSGTAAARAVLAGDIDLSVSPTPVIITQISNSNANLVGIYGIPNPDWVLASMDATKTCKDMVGQPVGVDSTGGARSLALRSILAGGCPEVKIDQVQQVALGSNVSPAMLAGQLNFGVLHLDDLAVIASKGKTAKTLLTIKETTPTSHYLLVIARKDKLQERRKEYVGVVAGLTAASRFVQDPKNADRAAEAAAPIGHEKAITKAALKQFVDLKMWSPDADGMDPKQLASVIDQQVKVGTIAAGKEPVKVEQLIDPSVWKDAVAMIK
jgi:ABC-type nitrate/sulfonate/bicarbonate transport system substrate-binding protein